MKEVIKRISDYAYEYLMETGKKEMNNVLGPKYRWEHTLRVTYWAWLLGLKRKQTSENVLSQHYFMMFLISFQKTIVNMELEARK